MQPRLLPFGHGGMHPGRARPRVGGAVAASARLIGISGGTVLHVLALTHCAVTIRHWFEVDLEDASMEHGARIEVTQLCDHEHRGSESAMRPGPGPQADSGSVGLAR
jgi:hypothetical protein